MYCVLHEWLGDDALFLALDYADAERIELAIARDRASGDDYADLSDDIRQQLASEDFRTAFAAIDAFCDAKDECLAIKTLATYLDLPREPLKLFDETFLREKEEPSVVLLDELNQASHSMIRPSRVALIPRILLIIDRSGSMNQTDLGLELGLVNKVLSGLRLRDAVRVIVGDTCAQSTQNVFDAKKVEIVGRGGTDVGAIMQQAYDDAVIKPQLIVAVTDGETPWPSNRLSIPGRYRKPGRREGYVEDV